MYISLLDYLEEVKKKFYIILITVAIFFLVGFSFNKYKENFYNVSVSTNLIKLTTLTIENLNLRTDTKVAIRWISDEATNKYAKINKYEFLPMKCESEDHFFNCVVSGKMENNIEDVKNNMSKSVTEAFESYEVYFINLIDSLIKSKEDLYMFVEESEITNIDAQIETKNAIQDTIFVKQVFETTLDEAKREIINNIVVKKHINIINYTLVLISSLICSLFIIFIQMKPKKNH